MAHHHGTGQVKGLGHSGQGRLDAGIGRLRRERRLAKRRQEAFPSDVPGRPAADPGTPAATNPFKAL